MKLSQVLVVATLSHAAFSSTIRRDSKPLPEFSEATVARFNQRVGTVSRNQRITDLIQTLSDEKIKEYVTHLTDEDNSGAIPTRASKSAGLTSAGSYITEQMQNAGAQCNKQDLHFGNNVICRFAGRSMTQPMIVLGVHYDAKALKAPKAPGANNGGSGIAAMLSIANSIHANSISFNSNVDFAFFSVEEGESKVGPLGSHVYSYELFNEGTNVDMMISAPQIAYRAPGEGMQLGLSKGTKYTTDAVADFVGKIASTYVPSLSVGNTPVASEAADNFHLAGFPSVTLFERKGAGVDPTVNTDRDVSNRTGFDYQQLKAIAQVEYASLLHAAGFN